MGGVTRNTQSQESYKGCDPASYRLARRVSVCSGTTPIILLAGLVSIVSVVKIPAQNSKRF
jgi:hypothetical protein